MNRLWLYLLLLSIQLSVKAQSMMAEDYYVTAFNEMSDMLYGQNTLSIKRAVFLAEWAFYEGKLEGLDVVVVQCGVGKVNAALCAQILQSRFL